jgi:hypothetical protein
MAEGGEFGIPTNTGCTAGSSNSVITNEQNFSAKITAILSQMKKNRNTIQIKMINIDRTYPN